MEHAKKYEFTGETRPHLGRTLHRIRALVSFGDIVAGDVGGLVEYEKNLSHYGNAWVDGDAQVCDNAQVSGDAWASGNALVCGDAQVYGNARVHGDAQVTPICVTGLTYPVTVTDHHMMIGCEFHRIAEWRVFDDRRIVQMDGLQAARFWRAHKATLLAICDAERPNGAEASQ